MVVMYRTSSGDIAGGVGSQAGEACSRKGIGAVEAGVA